MLNQAELEDILPLSPLQEGFLFLTQLDGDGPDVYIIQTVLDLEGAVDSARLQTAAQALLNRHPNLRAAFRRTAEGRPVALIPRRAQLPWRIVDLSGLDPQAQQAEAHQLILPLYVSVMQLAGSGIPGVRFDNEGSGYGFRTVRRLGPDDTALPTNCRMTRNWPDAQ